MKIKKIVFSKGRTGFYFDDQKAIKAGAKNDGTAYKGEPMTPGFTAIRQAGEAISVQIVLEDGQVAFGDCAAVQYSGAGGRDPLFLAEDFIKVLKAHVEPVFAGKEVTSFREMTKQLEEIKVDGKLLHTAIRYGFSQAILDAVAKANKMQMCEVVAKEYGTQVQKEIIPIFTQSGDDRYGNADKMIMKRASLLPHALINHVETKLGKNGEILADYIKWLAARIPELGGADYKPVIHIDVYGTIGQAMGNNNYEGMSAYLAELAKIAAPFQLYIEGPMDAGDRESQMIALRDLTKMLDDKKIPVKLVADEWCNTLEDIKYFADNKAGHIIQIKTPDLGSVHNTAEAVLYCVEKGVGAYQGGTCNETDRSSQVCAQVAMATGPMQILAKPGMGVDEGYMIVYNEMNRILALRD